MINFDCYKSLTLREIFVVAPAILHVLPEAVAVYLKVGYRSRHANHSP